ncbi:MAG: ATP-binding protein, partial [Mariprofundaceae bacterium]|nr:ATP-binding protein [Mariprofundaceae bacterium]
LARLQVALELARSKGSGEIEGELARIGSEAERLNAMIGEVLTLARMETGEQPGTHSRLALDALLANVVEDACFEAEASGRQVRLEHCEKADVHGDPALLHSALDNVIRNAIRHTPADTAVDVSLTCQENMAAIAVCDHGPGVPEQNLARLFEPFFRTPDSGGQTSDGFGLGLAIAHRAVQLHQGSIRAENHADGGLLVCLSLPLA